MKHLLLSMTLLAWLHSRLPAAPAGDPLDHWRQLNPDAALYALRAAHFAGDRWVAVTHHGRILTSLDPANWIETARLSPDFGMRAVQFGGGHWIALAGDGTVAASPDGLVWARAKWGASNRRLLSFSFGNGRWLAATADQATGAEEWFWSTNEVEWAKTIAPCRAKRLF